MPTATVSGVPEAPRSTGGAAGLPRHVAVILDGNGRWAQQRYLPRVAGHRRGLEAVRALVKECRRLDIPYLTLFAFSSENWQRPSTEVSFLMRLFMRALRRETALLHKNNIRLRIIGDTQIFEPTLREQINAAEQITAANTGMTLLVAANYGGRWEINQAVDKLLRHNDSVAPELRTSDITPFLALNPAPDPDLLIRTGGECRISNFLLWQLAYTELYFIDTLWPDFGTAELARALDWYRGRERRFGRIGAQTCRADDVA